MGLQSKSAALAVGLGLAIGFVPVTPAGALGSAGDTLSGASASLPLASSTAAGLSLTVTTDSVVATAVVHYTAHGPGRVSSKSLMPKTNCRSGDPKAPKFIRWASPQSWVVMPDRGPAARSAAMTRAAPL